MGDIKIALVYVTREDVCRQNPPKIFRSKGQGVSIYIPNPRFFISRTNHASVMTEKKKFRAVRGLDQ